MSLFKKLSSIKNYAKSSGVQLYFPQAEVETVEELCHEVCEIAMDSDRTGPGKGKVGAVLTQKSRDGALHVVARGKPGVKSDESYIGTTIK